MIEIIPAIDIISGECVRLTQGDYNKKSTYFKDPLEVALRYEGIGINRLHLVDLDGAKQSKPVNIQTLERIATRTSLDIQYGGGIKDSSALESVFNSGAQRAICGSIAVKSPEVFSTWLSLFGNKKIILGADVKDGKIAINGWLESAEYTINQLIDKFLHSGLVQVICTDISRDGMLTGPNYQLYTDLQNAYPSTELTVSGGISSISDIYRLNELGLRSVIVGKAIYEGCITINEIEKCIQNA